MAHAMAGQSRRLTSGGKAVIKLEATLETKLAKSSEDTEVS